LPPSGVIHDLTKWSNLERLLTGGDHLHSLDTSGNGRDVVGIWPTRVRREIGGFVLATFPGLVCAAEQASPVFRPELVMDSAIGFFLRCLLIAYNGSCLRVDFMNGTIELCLLRRDAARYRTGLAKGCIAGRLDEMRDLRTRSSRVHSDSATIGHCHIELEYPTSTRYYLRRHVVVRRAPSARKRNATVAGAQHLLQLRHTEKASYASSWREPC
jgi:hypothetical protein